jgi:4'-phosphopantetheinyl transferase
MKVRLSLPVCNPQIGRFTAVAYPEPMMTEPAVRISRLPLDPAQRLRALDVLSPAEAERFRRAPHDGFLLGRLLLHELADELASELTGQLTGELTGELTDRLTDRPTGAPVAITAVCAQCGEEHGRPVAAGLWLSVAHAEDLVVVAAAATPVGVDVEPVDADIPGEYGGNVHSWTRLEAVLKADGRGIVVDPRDVVFQDDATPSGTAAAETAAAETPAPETAAAGTATPGTAAAVSATVAGVRYFVREVDFDAAFVISLAWAETGPRAIHQTGRQAETR